MNNNKLRKDSNCLNCGNEVSGKYCSECGQLNREPQMSIHDLFHDLLHSMWHFDGKFFITIKYLIIKPGFLTSEYVKGKRSRYLSPVQMYLFTSAIFFFLLYTFFLHSPQQEENLNVKEFKNTENKIQINFPDSINKIPTLNEYQQQQSTISEDKKDGVIKRYFMELQLKLNEKFSKDRKGFLFEYIDHFIHSFSSLFFVSLPLIAFWFSLIFFKKKEYNVVTHFIFLTHNYVFDYVAVLLNFCLKSLSTIKGLGFLENIGALILLWMIFYGYLSTMNFYKLSRAKAFWKYSLALFGSFIIIAMLIIVYLIISALKMQ